MCTQVVQCHPDSTGGTRGKGEANLEDSCAVFAFSCPASPARLLHTWTASPRWAGRCRRGPEPGLQQPHPVSYHPSPPLGVHRSGRPDSAVTHLLNVFLGRIFLTVVFRIGIPQPPHVRVTEENLQTQNMLHTLRHGAPARSQVGPSSCLLTGQQPSAGCRGCQGAGALAQAGAAHVPGRLPIRGVASELT